MEIEVCQSNGARAGVVGVIARIPLAAGVAAEPCSHRRYRRGAPGEALW
jgi:hypothetical protein